MTYPEYMEEILCHADISTGCCWDEDKVELFIEFKDGPLAGNNYEIHAKKEDFANEN